MRLITPPLSGGVASFEDHDDLEPVVLDPVLQLDQFALQAEQLLEIEMPVQRRRSFVVGFCDPKLAELVILELELQLLVQTVPEVGADQFAYDMVVARIHLVAPVCGWLVQSSPWHLTVV